uniref:Uncharacterized protein n=1 Tax=Oryza rufipogon TaxID=4529 RepID=A0A0E0PZI7_ORYRU
MSITPCVLGFAQRLLASAPLLLPCSPAISATELARSRCKLHRLPAAAMEDGAAAREAERWEGYVDWRNRPAVRGRHGSMLAASFVLVVEVLENLAFLANASNLVTYLMNFMHYSPSQSATTVTNFMGTAFLLALLGGFLSDAFFTTYAIYLISAFVEFLSRSHDGILTVQLEQTPQDSWTRNKSHCGTFSRHFSHHLPRSDPIRSETTDHHLLSYPHPPSPRDRITQLITVIQPVLPYSPPTHTYDVRCPLACVRANRTPPHTTSHHTLVVNARDESVAQNQSWPPPARRAAFPAYVERDGLVVLTIQARTPSLMPPGCAKVAGAACEPVSGPKKAMLFAGLYVTALGIGGIKGSLPSHGAEQFDEHAPRGRKGRSTFFNYFVFCLSVGALIAVTFAVWVEDNKGWQWGFGISTIAILLSIPVFVAGSRLYRNKVPTGSPLTTIAKVVLAAALARRGGAQSASNGAVIDRAPSPTGSTDMKEYCKPGDICGVADGAAEVATEPSQELVFLNRAVQRQPRCGALSCTVREVEDVKIVLMVLPIFFSTIMLNSCLAQLSTFSVEQAATMDTRVGGLKVPPASLPVFPVTFIILLAPVYDHVIIPFARRATGTEMGITHLQRIGTGLVLSIVAMAVAAVVEVKRKNVASNAGMLDAAAPLPITFFWIAFQYLFLGSADLFTLAGLLEFFFSEAPARMRSLATSLSWASLALGYYLSSVLVTVVNSATGRGGRRAWLQGGNLNHYHLERFYWVMCVLSTLNYLFFLFWAIRYKYRNAGVIKG